MISKTMDNSRRQLIWFLEPKDDKGVSFLKIEHDDRDDEMPTTALLAESQLHLKPHRRTETTVKFWKLDVQNIDDRIPSTQTFGESTTTAL